MLLMYISNRLPKLLSICLYMLWVAFGLFRHSGCCVRLTLLVRALGACSVPPAGCPQWQEHVARGSGRAIAVASRCCTTGFLRGASQSDLFPDVDWDFLPCLEIRLQQNCVCVQKIDLVRSYVFAGAGNISPWPNLFRIMICAPISCLKLRSHVYIYIYIYIYM